MARELLEVVLERLLEAMKELVKVHPSEAKLAHLSVAQRELVKVNLLEAMKEPVKVHPSEAL